MAKIAIAMGKSPKTTRNYGHLNITSGDVSSLKNAKIGDKIKLEVEIEVTGLQKPDRWDIEEMGMKAGEVRIQSDIKGVKDCAPKNAKK